MSWSLHYSEPVRGEHLRQDLDERHNDFGTVSEEAFEQIELAKDVAFKIIKSGSVGSTEKEFNVSLSGHANPNHEPTSGWANDAITISISQK